MSGKATMVPVHKGWCGGRPVRYLDLGPVPATWGDVYILIHGADDEGNPLVVPDQHVIFDSAPGDPHYSPIWLVHYAVVSSDYVPDSLKSETDILRSGAPIVKSRLSVDCPLFSAGVRVQGDPISAKSGWYDGNRVFYLDFGQTAIGPANVYQFAYARLPGGLWNWVSNQAPVFDARPGDQNYSALRRLNLVMARASYRADSIHDLDAIYSWKLSVQPTAELYNMPLLESDDA